MISVLRLKERKRFNNFIAIEGYPRLIGLA